jgi:hypothetical protein
MSRRLLVAALGITVMTLAGCSASGTATRSIGLPASNGGPGPWEVLSQVLPTMDVAPGSRIVLDVSTGHVLTVIAPDDKGPIIILDPATGRVLNSFGPTPAG